jgi:hypothetical protein
MPHPRFSDDEIDRIGHELYEQQIRPTVEKEENIGKLVSIDIETGDYEIADELLVTARRILAKHPGAAIWSERIGFNAVYAVGGSLRRIVP